MAKITLNKLAGTCHRVAESYKAGIDLRTIWKRESNHGSPSYQHATGSVAEYIDQGDSLGEALAKTDGYFPDLTVAVATAGEKAGRLERAFHLLAEHYQSIIKFRNQVLMSVAWPLFELGATILIVGAMILIMGYVTGLAGGQPIDWLGFGWDTWQYFTAYVLFVVFVLGCLAALIVGTMRGWYGTVPFQIANRIPLIGKIIQYLSLSRLAWALSIVTEAGINIKEGVRLALRSTENMYFTQLQDEISDNLQEGQELTETLRSTNAFPSEFLMYTENGEMTGNLPETMQKLADDYLDRVRNLFRLLSIILFLVCFAIIAGVIIVAILFLFYNLIYAPQQDIMNDLYRTR